MTIKNEKQNVQNKQEDMEQPYMQTVLYIILVTACIMTATLTLMELFLDMKGIGIGISLLLVFIVIMLYFTYRKKLWIPRLLVPTIAFAAATYVCVTNNGMRDFTMFVFPVAILLAGLLIGKRGVILFTITTIFTASLLGYADLSNRLNSPLSQYTNVENIIIVDFLLFIMGSILYHTIEKLNKSIESARQSDIEAQHRYLELQSARKSLEERVAERSRSAEKAQQRAEKAHRTLERQMWQFSGKAHLSDFMRGEQNVSTLAHNVIRGLCEYLEVAIGALFLLEENILNLAGSYAYPLDDNSTPVSFAVGEGIVGQAVLEQRRIKISDVPAEYVEITSGLGEAPARHIFVIPFAEENRVVGVIEIGSFTELYPDQIRFIESVLKDIAIAFSTAQARERINDLLRETQQMAEELQAQEEELRAANEELEVQTERLRESYARLERQADEEVS